MCAILQAKMSDALSISCIPKNSRYMPKICPLIVTA